MPKGEGIHLVVDSTGVKVYGRWGMEDQNSRYR
ncbi:hypothetical protein [Okeania sp. SIO3I5]